MRRAILAVIGTAVGLVMLLTFKVHALSAGGIQGTTGTGGGTGTGSGTSTGGAPGADAAAAAPASGPATVLTGDVIDTPYGPTQVQLVRSGTRITRVNVLQHTDDGVMSEEIDSRALPQLVSETIKAQNGRIDAVSGASYTSAGYIRSLQNALDKKGTPVSSAAAAAKPTAAAEPPGMLTAKGPVINTQYGPVQVQVTVENDKIAKVTLLQQPAGAQSSKIDTSAFAALIKETLKAQSARVDMVTGATFTSQGYIRSLQNALDGNASGLGNANGFG